MIRHTQARTTHTRPPVQIAQPPDELDSSLSLFPTNAPTPRPAPHVCPKHSTLLRSAAPPLLCPGKRTAMPGPPPRQSKAAPPVHAPLTPPLAPPPNDPQGGPGGGPEAPQRGRNTGAGRAAAPGARGLGFGGFGVVAHARRRKTIALLPGTGVMMRSLGKQAHPFAHCSRPQYRSSLPA
jgi:hypothetical protein